MSILFGFGSGCSGAVIGTVGVTVACTVTGAVAMAVAGSAAGAEASLVEGAVAGAVAGASVCVLIVSFACAVACVVAGVVVAVVVACAVAGKDGRGALGEGYLECLHVPGKGIFVAGRFLFFFIEFIFGVRLRIFVETAVLLPCELGDVWTSASVDGDVVVVDGTVCLELVWSVVFVPIGGGVDGDCSTISTLLSSS